MSSSARISSFQRFCSRSLLLDWVALVICVGLLIGAQHLRPFKQQIMLGDMRIQHPFAANERVPSWMLLTFGAAVPVAVTALLLALLRKPWHTAHVALLGLGFSITTTDILTNLAKNSIGRPRPDLYERCMPKLFQPVDKWLDVGVCQNPNDRVIQDGWRSFPSGHSSFAFAGLGFLAFVIAGQLRVFRPNANYLKFLVMLVPLCLAASVAISRLEDYRHDAYDITAGSLLGLVVAYFSYRRYFPKLRDPKCEVAYEVNHEENLRSQRLRITDEEAGEVELNDADSEERIPLSTSPK